MRITSSDVPNKNTISLEPGQPFDLAAKKVVVMGLGRFGGGVGVTRYLIDQGADPLVTDLLPADQLKNSLAQLDGLPIEYRLGEHNVSDFTTADLIVVNPAIDPHNNRYLRAAMAGGIPLTSEIRLFTTALTLRNHRRTIAVTGTSGKSTVTAMIGHLLKNALGDSRVHVGGNLGGSLLASLGKIKPDHPVVLELSSFMLEGLDEDHWSAHIAAVTNFSPNHLDRHPTLHAYKSAKLAILKHQVAGDIAILGPGVADWPTAQGVLRHTTQPPRHNLVPLPGLHNQLNAMMAIDVARKVVGDHANLTDTLAGFSGLPHRLQLVCEHNGIRYFNDSKATTPQAAQLAISSLTSDVDTPDVRRNVHAILGGYDKAIDLTPLAQYAAQHCDAIYTLGTTGDRIATAAQDAGLAVQIHRCETLDRAVQWASQRATPGQTVLLSPGCASWDQFENYEQRGSAFVEAILKYNTER